MRILYKIGSGLWLVLNPANFNLGLFLLIFILPISLLLSCEFFAREKATDEYLHKDGVALLDVDKTTGLSIYKVGVDEPMDSLKVQSALLGKNFLLYGTPVSVVYEDITSSDEGQSSYVGIYSAYVSNKCLPALSEQFNERRNIIIEVGEQMYKNVYDASAKFVELSIRMGQDVPDFDMEVRNRMQRIRDPGLAVRSENQKLGDTIPRIDDTFSAACGKDVYFSRVKSIAPVSTLTAVPSALISDCLTAGCSKCQIIEGLTATGDCKPSFIEVKNDSKILYSNGESWLSESKTPVGKLPY